MIWLIVSKEIRSALLSLRFGLTLVLVVGLFAVNGFLFIGTHESKTRSYSEAATKAAEDLRGACGELSKVALHRQKGLLQPRAAAYVSEGFEKYLPNAIRVNAFRTFDPAGGSQGNSLYPRFAELDWTFVVGIVLSLTVLLMTYDCVCGEREDGTLRLALSFPVSRSALILGKFLGTMVVMGVAFLLGVLIGLTVIVLSPSVHLDGQTWLRVGLAMAASLLYLSCFALLGVAVSALVRLSATSLVILLFAWVVSCLLIPNVAGLVSGKLSPIPTRMAIGERVSEARKEAVSDAPEGTWSYNGGNPFMPNHELRADAVTKQNAAEMKIRNDYWNQTVSQARSARAIARISPAAAYMHLCESLSGVGVERLVRLRQDLQVYKDVLLQFVREADADDKDSPHWINPGHGFFFSRKPIAFEEVPKPRQTEVSVAQSVSDGLVDILVLSLFGLAFFAVGYAAFRRYDVR